MDRAITVFFSNSGNTSRIAHTINLEAGGSICRLNPVYPYPSDYENVLIRAKLEISKGCLPALETRVYDLAEYDLFFIGSPNWCGTIAPPVATFLAEYDLSNKLIAPFITHSGDGAGRCCEAIRELCPRSRLARCLSIYENGGMAAEATIHEWLIDTGVLDQEKEI